MDLILYEERKGESSVPLARYRFCTVGRDVLCDRLRSAAGLVP